MQAARQVPPLPSTRPCEPFDCASSAAKGKLNGSAQNVQCRPAGTTIGNLYVLCKGCNYGKSACIAREQLPSFIDLPQRSTLLGVYPLSTEVFYADRPQAHVLQDGSGCSGF
jgi:hypothetical protein